MLLIIDNAVMCSTSVKQMSAQVVACQKQTERFAPSCKQMTKLTRRAENRTYSRITGDHRLFADYGQRRKSASSRHRALIPTAMRAKHERRQRLSPSVLQRQDRTSNWSAIDQVAQIAGLGHTKNNLRHDVGTKMDWLGA